MEAPGFVKTDTWKTLGATLVAGALLSLWATTATWGLGYQSQSDVKAKVSSAEQARDVKYCVARYKNDPKGADAVAEMKAGSSWERDKIVEKYGWHLLPGEKKPLGTSIASDCARAVATDAKLS